MSTLTTLEISLVVVALEFGAIALTFGLMLRKRGVETVKTAQEEAKAAVEFAEAVVEKEPSRREALELIFREKYKLDDDTIAARADEFVERERAFYQTLIATFAKRDGKGLGNIGEQLNGVIAPWVSLVPAGMVSEEKLADLTEEKESLSAELEHNKTVLEELMTEYDRAFHKDTAAGAEDSAEDGAGGSIDDIAEVNAPAAVAATEPESRTGDDIDLFAEDDEDEALLVDRGEEQADASTASTAADAATGDDEEDDLNLDLSPGDSALEDDDDALVVAAAEDLASDAGTEAGDDDVAVEVGVGAESGPDAGSTEAGDEEIIPLNAGEIDELLESLDSEPA